MRALRVTPTLAALWLATLVHAEVPESPLDSAARLAGSEPSLAQLRAVRGAPFGPSPLAELPRLVRLAGGRDPTLAPAAAVAIHRIAERAEPGASSAAELLDAELEASVTALRALAADEAVRGDVRRLAGEAAAMLTRPN